MDIYQKLREEQALKRQENEFKKESLEKQLKIWQKRRKELRNVNSSSLDAAFTRRQLDKCENEIDKISKALAKL